MLRKRLLQASLVLLFGVVADVAKTSPMMAADGVAQGQLPRSFTVTLNYPPGETTPHDHLCVGTEYEFTTSTSGGTAPFEYNWEVDTDWLTSHASSLSYTFSSVGWHSVTVEVYDATLFRNAERIYVFLDDSPFCIPD
jgi:hypothetical protein